MSIQHVSLEQNQWDYLVELLRDIRGLLEKQLKPDCDKNLNPTHTCPEPGCECPYIHGLTIPCNKCGHAPREPIPVVNEAQPDHRYWFHEAEVSFFKNRIADLEKELGDEKGLGLLARDEIGRLRHDLAAMTEAKDHAVSEATRHFEGRLQAKDEGAREERERIIKLFSDTVAKGGLPLAVIEWDEECPWDHPDLLDSDQLRPYLEPKP